MRQSAFTGLTPANDVRVDDRQPIFLGIDFSTAPDMTAVGRLEADGSVTLVEAIERGAEPETALGRRLFRCVP